MPFTRLARCVRASITLENRIANPPAGRARQPLEPDPFDPGIEDVDAFLRTGFLNEALFKTSRSEPERWDISQNTPAILDEVVARLPHLPLSALFEQAAETLGFQPDLTCLTPFLKSKIYPDPP